MEIVLKSEIPDWLNSDALNQIMGIIGLSHDKTASLLVGGCVRNTVMVGVPTDIDIATKYTPQEVTDLLESKNIKVVPTGFNHGTVTAIIDGVPFEITTLRKDIATDGRHASVEFTNDWGEDAARRDFTTNTLLMDMSGNIYDPTGQGLVDLKQCHIKFVGEAAKRIEEDYLRILRLFRFQAQYGEKDIDEAALKACRDASDKISSLSKERVTQEFFKIIAVKDPTDILKTMFSNNVLNEIADKNYNRDILHKLCYFQDEYQADNIVARLFVLAGFKPKLFDETLMLSHVQKKFIIKLEMATRGELYVNEKSLKKAIFHHGRDLLLQGYFLFCAKADVMPEQAMLETLKNWEIPECPITGQTLIDEGYKTGPELGQELNRLQEEWLDRVV